VKLWARVRCVVFLIHSVHSKQLVTCGILWQHSMWHNIQTSDMILLKSDLFKHYTVNYNKQHIIYSWMAKTISVKFTRYNYQSEAPATTQMTGSTKVNPRHVCTKRLYQLCDKTWRMTAVSLPASWQSMLVQSRSTCLEPQCFCQCRLECQKHLHQLHNHLTLPQLCVKVNYWSQTSTLPFYCFTIIIQINLY